MSQTVIDPQSPADDRSAAPPVEPAAAAPAEAGPAPVEASSGTQVVEPSRVTELEDRLQRTMVSRDGWTLTIFVFSALALLAAAFGVGLGWRAVDESKRGTGTAALPEPEAVAAPATVSVNLSDFAVEPAELRVAEGGSLKVTNTGAVPHDLAVKGTNHGTEMLDSGASATLDLTGLAPGTYTVICTVPGHEVAGMTGVLHVGDAGAPAVRGAAPAAAQDAGAVIDFGAAPGPQWKAFDPALQPAPGGTTHDVTFHATETVVEVAPGVTQELWTFNNQVPGPTLRGKVGDVFNVTLVNDGKVGHSIDFHASKVAPNGVMRTIGTGESLVYQFKAEHAGVWMYHCGTAPALHHIGNGMYGAVVIDPPGLPAVDREYVMVQSELYLGPQGKPGDLRKMQDEAFDAVVFNGYVNQYKHSPIKVEVGQRVRVWVLDAGPSENSSFHVVGTIFDTVYKEGQYLLRPDGTRGGAQSLDLQPSQGGFVEFTLPEPGQYPMVTHKFSNVGKGALGLFQAGAGGPAGH